MDEFEDLSDSEAVPHPAHYRNPTISYRLKTEKPQDLAVKKP